MVIDKRSLDDIVADMLTGDMSESTEGFEVSLTDNLEEAVRLSLEARERYLQIQKDNADRFKLCYRMLEQYKNTFACIDIMTAD